MSFAAINLELGKLYTRQRLSELWGYSGQQAISRGVFTPAGSNSILLFVTRQKQKSLTQYNDFINGDHLHWEGEQKHGNDLRIANAHKNGSQILLFYRDIHHTPFRYYGSIRINLFVNKTSKPSEFVFELEHDLSPQDDILLAQNQLKGIPDTEKEMIIKARVGQGKFREDLFRHWGGCAITNIRQPDLLRASHIKPWRASENEERINPFNGLLLVPQYDHLFDRGYISFENSGTLLLSPAIKSLPAEKLGIDFKCRLRNLDSSHIPFLTHHREQVFLFKTSGE